MSEQEESVKEENTTHHGLYIHIPFCRSKCPYCDFYSIASFSLIPRWFEALKMEMKFYTDKFVCFDTVYLGGGTPSLLDVSLIGEVLASINNNFKILEKAEITIEVNPGDLTIEKIRELKPLGINRINLGVQSFSDDDLLFLGRRHRVKDSRQALNALREAGFENIGIDLIYGLKDQSPGEWLKTLKRAVSFNPEHISCYQLTFEGKTVFNAMKARGELKELSEDTASRFFIETSAFLEQQGFLHYEVSNFAKRPELRSRHNMKYWKRVPYLGLGPSAHSFDGEKRWWN
ncbi:MAG: radical SAM family heme chaperone HemW, partial [Deltaproteobacteria bacterium]|nr:radical SAM family heme chaperone HemW [Deltaproteobacteria bacterium]